MSRGVQRLRLLRHWPMIAVAIVLVSVALTYRVWLPATTQLLGSESLATAADALRQLGLWAPVASLLLMVIQSVIAPLPGSVVAAANGALFGPWWGSLLSWAGGMAGALVTYWIGWFLGERAPARWRDNPQWQRLSDLGGDRGFWVVLMARLTPVISLDFIGYLAGVARMPFRRYMLANVLGLAPGMIIYTIVGSDLASARGFSWQVGAAALGLVVLFLLGRRFFARR